MFQMRRVVVSELEASATDIQRARSPVLPAVLIQFCVGLLLQAAGDSPYLLSVALGVRDTAHLVRPTATPGQVVAA